MSTPAFTVMGVVERMLGHAAGGRRDALEDLPWDICRAKLIATA